MKKNWERPFASPAFRGKNFLLRPRSGWNTLEKARRKKSLERSLKRLQTDYIDLVLLHQPFNDIYGAWRDLEKMYKADTLKAIGLSNF